MVSDSTTPVTIPAHPGPTSDSPRWGPQAYYDPLRDEEFYRYYAPTQAAVGIRPQWLDLHDQVAIDQHQPLPSPDRALTAFCQLAAIKLDVRRAMIFLFDASHGYVLAEATKSISLRAGLQTEKGDELWLGHAMIPRGYSVCEHTVNLPHNNVPNSHHSFAGIAHIINDLSGDVRFCNRPFVTDGPRARYYCGVPIITPTGASIGALCALHDAPRETTTPGEIETLVDLAAAVMLHLEAVRAKAENQLGTIRLNSLAQFTQGVNVLFGDSTPNAKSQDDHRATTSQRRRSTTSGQSTDLSGTTASKLVPRTQQVAEDFDQEEQPPRFINSNPTSTPSRSDRQETSGVSTSTLAINTVDGMSVKDVMMHVMQFAASLLRPALLVDGVAFFDACTTRSVQRSGSQESISIVQLAGSASCTTSTGDDLPDQAQGRSPVNAPIRKAAQEPHKGSTILGLSQSAHASSPQTPHLSQRTLRKLARRYPSGKSWHLPQDDVTSEPSTTSDSQASKRPGISGFAKAKKTSNSTGDERLFLQSISRARNILFVPLWNHSSGELAAGVVLHTESPLRLFTLEGELKFMGVFCNAISTALARLEAQQTLQTKAAFISSISHELRTPLHGILGTVDHLRDGSYDLERDTLLSQIERCGTIMLDVINQVLDFKQADRMTRDAVPVYHSPTALVEPFRSHDGAIDVIRDDAHTRRHPHVALERTTEDVISSAIYSYYCNKEPDNIPTIVLDIEDVPSVTWTTRMDSGSWKRVVINIVVNALKYTSNGMVSITLKQEPAEDERGHPKAVLSVSDTGCGMSESYMRSSLFQPFTQADSLAEGSGLGLSLVRRLLKTVHGSVSVESIENVSTTVTIKLPLLTSQKRRDLLIRTTMESRIKHSGMILRPRFSGESWDSRDDEIDQGRVALQTSLTNSVKQIAAYIKCNSFSKIDTTVLFIAEDDVSEFDNEVPNDRSSGRTRTIVIIICRTWRRIRECRTLTETIQNRSGHRAELMLPPYGPLQLATCVVACLSAFQDDFDLSQAIAWINQSARSEEPPRRPKYPSTRSFDKATRTYQSLSLTGLSSSCNATWHTGSEKVSDEDGERDPTTIASSDTTDSVNRPEAYISAIDSTEIASIENSPCIPARARSLKPIHDMQTSSQQVQNLSSPAAISTYSCRRDVTLLLVDDNEINMRLLSIFADRNGYGRLVAKDGLEACQLYGTALNGAVETHLTTPRPIDSKTTFGKAYRGEHLSVESLDRNGQQDQAYFDMVAEQPSSAKTILSWPQVTLMDINMPLMNGYEAARRIRTIEAESGHHFRTYIIAMTGLGGDEARTKAFESGMDLFLTKPVRLKELAQILSEHG